MINHYNRSNGFYEKKEKEIWGHATAVTLHGKRMLNFRPNSGNFSGWDPSFL